MIAKFAAAAIGVFIFLVIIGFACGDGKTDSHASAKQAEVTHYVNNSLPVQQPTAAVPTAAPTKVQQPAPTKAPAPTLAPAPTKAPVVSRRRPCPQGQGPCPFSAGEPVVGYRMKIGNLWYGNACFIAAAPGPGTVEDGTVYPDSGEILPPCSAGVESLDTVNGHAQRACPKGSGPCSFAAGEAVIGWQITMSGLKYRTCYMASAPAAGTVEDGLINPNKDQVTLPPCGAGVQDPDTVNGQPRRTSGTFSAGEAVVGYFKIGTKDYTNCYMAAAPAAGTIVEGSAVINPWRGELKPACN